MKKEIVGVRESHSVVFARNLITWNMNKNLKGNKQA